MNVNFRSIYVSILSVSTNIFGIFHLRNPSGNDIYSWFILWVGVIIDKNFYSNFIKVILPVINIIKIPYWTIEFTAVFSNCSVWSLATKQKKLPDFHNLFLISLIEIKQKHQKYNKTECKIIPNLQIDYW